MQQTAGTTSKSIGGQNKGLGQPGEETGPGTNTNRSKEVKGPSSGSKQAKEKQ